MFSDPNQISLQHVLLSVRPNESKSRQIVDEAIDAFLARLEQNKLFKKASRLYSSKYHGGFMRGGGGSGVKSAKLVLIHSQESLSSADPSEAAKSLGDSFRSLWFSSGNPGR